MPIAPPTTDSNKLSWTIKEIGKQVGVSRSTLYAAISNNELRAVKCGHRTLILTKDLLSWIEAWPSVTRNRRELPQ